MKNVNVFITMVLIVFLLLSVLGCSRNQTNGVKKDAESGEKIEQQVEKSSGGAKQKKISYPNLRVLLNATIEEDMEEACRVFEEKYSGKVILDKVLYKDKMSKLIAAVAGGDAYDVVDWTQGDMPTYVIKDLIQPIESYFDLKDPLWNVGALEEYKYNGKYYGVNRRVVPGLIYYNKTMFENNGVKTPTEYYKEGNWNWETFRKVGMALTMDIDRDGTIDQLGYGGLRPDLFVYANGADLAQYNEDGTIKLNFHDERVIQALQFVWDGYNTDKYIRPQGGSMIDVFTNNKIAMFGERLQQSIKEKWTFEWDFVSFPNGPTGTKDVTAGGCGYWGIPMGAKEPGASAAWIQLNVKVFTENEEKILGKDYTPEQIKLINRLSKAVVLNHYVGIGNINKPISSLWKAFEKGTPVLTALETIMPQCQAEIELLFSGATK